jgi:aspartate aminotransferase
MVGEFDRRRRVIVEGLNRIPGVRCATPQGAFYAFPNVSGLFGRTWQGRSLASSSDVTAFLLEAARVAVVPGLDFGSDRHIRLSYATDVETIRQALARIDAAVRSLGG